MQKILLSFLLTGLLLFCFSQKKPSPGAVALWQNYRFAEGMFQQAEKQADLAGDDEALLEKADQLYQQALLAFTDVLTDSEKNNDSLAFLVKLKTGFIHYYFDKPIEAKQDYLAVLALKKQLPSIPDSLLFIPSLYTGAIYYEQHQFDSALHYYKQAERINDAAPKMLDEAERLYNRLGAMFYETGNYKQARNYFEKAVALTNADNTSLLTNYRINIASLLVKLEDYEPARAIFEQLLPSAAFENEIYHNLGIISLKQKEFQKAIKYFRKVRYTNNKKQIDLLYNFALTFSELQQQDSSTHYLEKALVENKYWYENRKSIPHGLLLKFQADEWLRKKEFKKATDRYQEAIQQFHPAYRDSNSYSNPESFTGVFSFINLFNTLVAKATAFEEWYRQKKDTQLLVTSLRSYQAAFQLAAYVEKTYNSDEARLFLGKIKYTVHSKPIEIALLLYELSKQEKYFEAAYLFDQQNKASALALTIRENELRANLGNTDQLVQKESILKTAITRLSLKASNADSIELVKINSEVREMEIQLGKLQEQLNKEPEAVQNRSLNQIPPVDELQNKLDRQTALLSFHLSANELVAFIITSNDFAHKRTAIDSNFFKQVAALKQALYYTSPDQRYTGEQAASYLYLQLLAPFREQLEKVERIIIIPDDELNYLSFEALQDEKKKYLVEDFSVQYQYTTALFGKNNTQRSSHDVLSFAPFASKEGADTSGNQYRVLPASGDEVTNLPGKSFIDGEATKENFLRYVNHYSILHLATHASVNNEEPSRSFIAFYPRQQDHKLFATEIADLQLDSTRLVILSACETGTGQLVKGEGLMSLSRAFAYAGCPNIITSLWKAEDRTTAFLTKRLHHYLDKKYTMDKALQYARLDLFAKNDTDPRFKSPNYWAHLIFIGEYESTASSSNKKLILFIAIGLALLIAGLFLIKSLFAKRKQARFS